MYIYVATNTVNGKQYVGQTVQQPGRRWAAHLNTAAKNQADNYPGTCRALHRAIRKYGADAFVVRIIALPEGCSRELLDSIEQKLIAKLGTVSPHGYNLTSGGRTTRFSAESKAKMSAAWGPTRPPRKHPMLGKKHSEASKAKMRASSKNKGQPSIRRGVTHTEETKLKMRDGWARRNAKGIRSPKLGTKASPEARANMRGAHLGYKASAETRVKLKAHARRIWDNPAYQAKQSALMTARHKRNREEKMRTALYFCAFLMIPDHAK